MLQTCLAMVVVDTFCIEVEMAKSNFEPEIRESMKPKSPRQDAKADGAGQDQAAVGKDVPRPLPPGTPSHVALQPDTTALPPHLAAAAGIAHAIINNRPAR